MIRRQGPKQEGEDELSGAGPEVYISEKCDSSICQKRVIKAIASRSNSI